MACPYCYPEVVQHRQEKLNSFIMAYISNPLATVFGNRLCFTDRYLTATVKILHKIKKLEKHQDINLQQSFTTLRLYWQEAQKLGLELYIFSLYKRQLLSFLLVYEGQSFYYHYSPTTLLHKRFKKFKDPTIYDDKSVFKRLLVQNQLPHAPGAVFFSQKRALQYGLQMGFPLVVKPASSTFSHHVSLNINTVADLKQAIAVAKIIDCRILVERFIPGEAHRMMVVGDRFLVCSKRTRPCIIGDGNSSIDRLIDCFNSDPKRGSTEQMGFALYQIAKTKTVLHYLDKQGLHLQSILPQGKKVYLSDKSNCSNGAEVINLSEQVCPENIELFVSLHKMLGIAVSAVDFIATDISKPWFQQDFAFLENNSFPAIDPQHFPSAGTPVNVAQAIWLYVLSHIESPQHRPRGRTFR